MSSSQFSWMSGLFSAFSLTPDWQTAEVCVCVCVFRWVNGWRGIPQRQLVIGPELWRLKCFLYRTLESSTLFLQAHTCSSLERWLTCSNQHRDLTVIFIHTHAHSSVCTQAQAKSQHLTLIEIISAQATTAAENLHYFQQMIWILVVNFIKNAKRFSDKNMKNQDSYEPITLQN